jgi:hypothetical protein
MKKIVRLTESDLARIVKRVIQEQKETFKVGDMFKITNPNGSHVRFKIDKVANYGGDASYDGTILGVFGDVEGERGVAKKGDKISFDVQGDGITFYIPSIDGEMESGSISIGDLKKLN